MADKVTPRLVCKLHFNWSWHKQWSWSNQRSHQNGGHITQTTGLSTIPEKCMWINMSLPQSLSQSLSKLKPQLKSLPKEAVSLSLVQRRSYWLNNCFRPSSITCCSSSSTSSFNKSFEEKGTETVAEEPIPMPEKRGRKQKAQ